MKKAQIYRRLKTMFTAFRNVFLEEEPRDKARRTMREATESLNRIIYQRFALEHEYHSGNLDDEAKMWCEENLKRLHESERAMSEHLTSLREQYRTLMLQDLFYKSINDPTADCFEQAQTALLELQASVEGERTLRSIPRLLDGRNLPPLPRTVDVTEETFQETESCEGFGDILVDNEPSHEEANP